MSSITDKFNKVSDGTGAYPAVAAVVSARNVGDKVLSCNSLAGWAKDTPVHFSTFRLNADGSVNTASQTDWKGIVSGNTVTQLTRVAGAADAGNLAGDVIILNPTSGWADDLISGILVSHTQSGAIKDGAVTSGAIGTGAVTEAKIGSSAVTMAKIKDGAVNTDKIADKAVTADKVDWQTMKSFVPDYGAQTEISLPYTVSAKGFLRVAATGKRVQINGYTVYGTSNSGYVFYSVATGDAISAPDGADGVTAHFYAGKWV